MIWLIYGGTVVLSCAAKSIIYHNSKLRVDRKLEKKGQFINDKRDGFEKFTDICFRYILSFVPLINISDTLNLVANRKNIDNNRIEYFEDACCIENIEQKVSKPKVIENNNQKNKVQENNQPIKKVETYKKPTVSKNNTETKMTYSEVIYFDEYTASLDTLIYVKKRALEIDRLLRDNYIKTPNANEKNKLVDMINLVDAKYTSIVKQINKLTQGNAQTLKR